MKNLGECEKGIGMVITIGFMALTVPIITGALANSGALSKDSQAKIRIAKNQYAALGCREHGISRLVHDTWFANSLEEGVPDSSTSVTLNGINCTTTITKGETITGGEVAYGDIVLALDISGSIDSTELNDLKQAANAIVDHFNLATAGENIGIGVTRFRGSSASVVPVTNQDYPGIYEPLNDGINGLVQGGPGLEEGTNTVAGLQGAAAQFNTGLGDRPELPNVIIVITDGDDNWGNSQAAIASASADTGAEVFAVGVGNEVQLATLNSIASEPDLDHVFTVSNYSGLLALVDAVVTQVDESMLTGTVFHLQSTLPNGDTFETQVIITPDGRVL